MSLLERISEDQGIADLRGASEDHKLRICGIVLREIFETLLKTNLLHLPKAMLIDFLDSLCEIIGGFYELQTTPMEQKIPLSQVIAIVSNAYSHLLAASTILEEAGETFEYFQHVQDCRDKLFEAIESL